MQKPFEVIFNAPDYRLRYTYRNDSINIGEDIEKTLIQYGEEGVSDIHFNKLINLLTNGASHSVLAHRKDPRIISKLCSCFPKMLNKKYIDSIIKCINSNSYPQSSIDEIINAGLSFSLQQIKTLHSNGYLMLNTLKTMNYEEFISLFENSTFFANIEANIGVDYDDDQNKYLINDKIIALKSICDKYNIIVEPNILKIILNKMVQKIRMSHDWLNIIINVHIIVEKLSAGFANETLLEIFVNYNLFNINDAQPIIRYDKIKQLINYYDKSIITRDFILKNILNVNLFKTLIHPSITEYNPVEDIYVIVGQIKDSYYIVKYIEHLIEHNYLKYDEFLLYLLSLGFDKNCTILNKYLKINNMFIDEKYINNFFTFSDGESINMISDCKILPTMDNILQCTKKEQLRLIQNTNIFLDDQSEKYINLITNENYTESPKLNINEEIFLEIYNSVNEKDKQILSRISFNDILNISTIIRYDIKLSKTYVTYMTIYGYLNEIILLIYLSNNNNYLIEMFDIELILLIPSTLGRMWMLNNCYHGNICCYILPDNLYDNKFNLEFDLNNLMKIPIINNINDIKNCVLTKKETNRRIMMENL